MQQSHVQRSPRNRERGMLLISSLLIISLFLVYSSSLALRTSTQQRVADQLHDRLQALALAQGATEQLREDFFRFLTERIYQQAYFSNALPALQWLDSLGDVIRGAGGLAERDGLRFDFPLVDTNADGRVDWNDATDGNRDGVSANPRCVNTAPPTSTLLPTIRTAACVSPIAEPVPQAPRAWITSVCVNPADEGPIEDCKPDTNPFAPRRVTIRAQANVGGATRTTQATYEIALAASDIFRNAYFINNYGWFNMSGGGSLTVHGEVRANGDLAFTGSTSNMYVQGDLYASNNPALKNPITLMPAAGTITGNPNEWSSMSNYWNWKSSWARPTRKLTFTPSQPAIGTPTLPKILPYGQGWNTEPRPSPQPAFPQQQQFPAQPIQDIPYLGDLSLYKNMASQMGSSLTYYVGSRRRVINAVYKGPDGVAGNSDDTQPLVLVGTSARPIMINGPVVIPGDTIIKGVVRGQGTIYAGRNLHIVGDVTYQQPPAWDSLERNAGGNGRIRRRGGGPVLGAVCTDGTYKPGPGASCP